MTSTAIAALLVACGGGGGGAPAEASGLQVAGTAATGAALSNALVNVKCASGTGSATTNATGGYTVTVTDGALPCIVKVSGTSADGTAVTLHSIADTTGTANVTPLTEMIVAQLAKANPAELFEAFNAGGISAAALTQATTAVVAALKTATGIDLGTIDPFKATLVPATATTAGNDYDKALDALKALVPTEGLPIIVTQIANAAANNSTTALGEVMTSVNLGSLENCPTALSGKYRVLDYLGTSDVVSFDFKAKLMTATSSEGTFELPITPSTTQNCQFAVGSNTFYMGQQGVGVIRTFDSIGYVFPVQAHSFASTVGEWSFLESGLEESNAGAHYAGKINVAADRSVTVCQYDATLTNCPAESEKPTVEDHAADGSFLLSYASDASVSRVWGYKAPSGSMTLFGASNDTGGNTPGTYRTHFVAAKLQPLQLPAVGSSSKFWNLNLDYLPGTMQPFVASQTSATSQTVTSVDTAAGSFTRSFNTGGSDTLLVNQPVPGTRSRTATNPAIHVILPGLGVVAVIDNRADAHYFALAVNRP